MTTETANSIKHARIREPARTPGRRSAGTRGLLALLFCSCISFVHADQWVFSDVDRIVAVSDVHGAYDAMVATFLNAGVIDEDLAWSGSETHLVITGDLLDRGPDSRRVMDLVMRLEKEAVAAGGRVHQLLGNHEVMNLIGDLRYVAAAEFAAFDDEESADERELWHRHYWRGKPAEADPVAVRREFDERAPPGFFGHRDAFRSDGTYGRWLLEKPLMVVINKTAFVHGGMPSYVAERGLPGVNGTLRDDLREYLRAFSDLVESGLVSPVDGFRDRTPMLTARVQAGQLEEELVESVMELVELSESPLHGSEGPLWYRGTAACSSFVEGDHLDAALSRIGATRVVVGHTPTVTRRVQQRINGNVIEIDTGMLYPSYRGSGNALIIEGDTVTVVNQDGRTNLSPIAHPRRVGYRSETIDAEVLTGILTDGAVVDENPDAEGPRLMRVTSGDDTVLAYFRVAPGENGFVPELAAYRLDRMLHLDMVPVTVRREIAGQQGTLQFIPSEVLTERDRAAAGEGGRARCSLDRQKRAMTIFDALIGNPARTPSSMLYSPEDWQLMLVDHERSFDTDMKVLPYLQDNEIAIGDYSRTVLSELDDEALYKGLGEVLDKKRLAALAQRRDALLEHARRFDSAPDGSE